MGYATVAPYTLFEFCCENEPTVTLTTVLTTHDLNDVIVPSFRGNPDYVYIDIYVQGWENTAVGVNYFKNTSAVGIRDSGATFRNGGGIGEQVGSTPGATVKDGVLCLPGTVNLAQYIGAGDTITPALSAKSHADNLVLSNVYGRIRMYFSVV